MELLLDANKCFDVMITFLIGHKFLQQKKQNFVEYILKNILILQNISKVCYSMMLCVRNIQIIVFINYKYDLMAK